MKKTFSGMYLAFAFIFLYAPIIFLMVFSFNEGKYSGNWEGFSLKWYIQLLEDRYIMKALYNTIIIAVISSILSTIIGTFAAYGIYNMKIIPQRLTLTLNNLPIINPDIVTGVSLMALFAIFSMDFGLVTLIIAHITFSVPYVILSVLPKLKQLPKDTIEASLDLGATQTQTFFKVVLPEIMPGIVAGLLIAFTLSIDDFVISFFTTGSGVSNLSITIYSMARRGISPKINALSTMMFVTVISMLLIVNKKVEVKDI
jgi:spermidine/putrescine transport system permease protein